MYLATNHLSQLANGCHANVGGTMSNALMIRVKAVHEGPTELLLAKPPQPTLTAGGTATTCTASRFRFRNMLFAPYAAAAPAVPECCCCACGGSAANQLFTDGVGLNKGDLVLLWRPQPPPKLLNKPAPGCECSPATQKATTLARLSTTCTAGYAAASPQPVAAAAETYAEPMLLEYGTNKQRPVPEAALIYVEGGDKYQGAVFACFAPGWLIQLSVANDAAKQPATTNEEGGSSGAEPLKPKEPAVTTPVETTTDNNKPVTDGTNPPTTPDAEEDNTPPAPAAASARR